MRRVGDVGRRVGDAWETWGDARTSLIGTLREAIDFEKQKKQTNVKIIVV